MKTSLFKIKYLALLLLMAGLFNNAFAKNGIVNEKTFEVATFKILSKPSLKKNGLLQVTPCPTCSQINLKYSLGTFIIKNGHNDANHALTFYQGKTVGISYLLENKLITKIIVPETY